jgi:hypothetical protein
MASSTVRLVPPVLMLTGHFYQVRVIEYGNKVASSPHQCLLYKHASATEACNLSKGATMADIIHNASVLYLFIVCIPKITHFIIQVFDAMLLKSKSIPHHGKCFPA